MKFIVIGITDSRQPWFPPELQEIIKNGKVFSGGKRHHEIVAPLLPEGAEWIDITAPLDAVFEQYKTLSRPFPVRDGSGYTEGHDLSASLPSRERLRVLSGESVPEGRSGATAGMGHGGGAVIVFASGDPLFFGFANTIKRRMPEAEIVVYPTFNSLQMLAHRLVIPYHDMRIVSLTGRPWPEFDRALIERAVKIGVLTDKEHTPAAIAQRMLYYGYTEYTMSVGEHLGNPEKEKVTTLTLEEAARHEFEHPNCLVLNSCNSCVPSVASDQRSSACNSWSKKQLQFGIPDREFTLLDGREKMITKMPIRLLTLQALDLPRKQVLWDIGFCTGSVSIEARLQFPHLHIEAFEIRPECEAIIHENARRHGAPGINVHIGDFLTTSLPVGDGVGMRLPDAVFIGGHGGKLKEIMKKVLTVLADNGCIVMNSVKAPKVLTDSHQLWEEACRELGLHQAPPTKIILNDNHPIEILKAHK